ncbi:hypothetical protein GCM10011571_32450 [Marinithermofilum abyssi]|uniref:PIN domain-containing protein n=1 Tax=Marinithermofilum abyssi TaxID=1571185 RepID=A0A8J2VL77_9BACL|nr:hypothetical protein GCM10011571_32450 [Marinithermofilum abyssi]
MPRTYPHAKEWTEQGGKGEKSVVTLHSMDGYTGQIKRVSLTLEDLSSWNGVTPDPDDRHILAAAFKADVDHIISTDVKHLLNGSVQKNIHHRWFELKMEKPNNESKPLVLSPKHFFEQYPKYRS